MKRIILVDDDELVQMAWRLIAEKKGIELTVYSSPTEIISSDITDKEIPIYIDYNFEGDDLKGADVARKLLDRGHKSLHLVTGMDPDDVSEKGLFESISGKEPPF